MFPNFGKCPFAWGVPYDPTISMGPANRPESLELGKVFWVFGPGGDLRRVRIMKNTYSGDLTAGQVVKNSTSAGRFRKDATLATADTDQVAGVVEDGYTGGVPQNYWFRCVEYAERHIVNIGTTNSARYTTTVGGPLVSSSDDGCAWNQDTSAANNAVQNRLGFALEAITNGVDNLTATTIEAEINVLNGGV